MHVSPQELPVGGEVCRDFPWHVSAADYVRFLPPYSPGGSPGHPGNASTTGEGYNS